MKRIELNIPEDKLEELLNKLDEFILSDCDNERCITLFGLSISEYRNHCITNKIVK